MHSLSIVTQSLGQPRHLEHMVFPSFTDAREGLPLGKAMDLREVPAFTGVKVEHTQARRVKKSHSAAWRMSQMHILSNYTILHHINVTRLAHQKVRICPCCVVFR